MRKRSSNSIDLPALPSGLDLLRLARSMTLGLHHGRHRSLARGGSAEFYDFRAYTPGDPTRLIDWRLFGRTDRVYLRRFQQETRIDLLLVVDASASMRFGGVATENEPSVVTKLRRACELAAALSYLAVKGGDRVGLVVTDGEETQVTPPAGGWPALQAVLSGLEGALRAKVTRVVKRRGQGPQPQRTLAEGLEAAAGLARLGGVVVAVSDALDEPGPIVEAVTRLRFAGTRLRRDIALVQVLSDDELTLPAIGAARLLDPETGLEVETDPDEVAAAYSARLRSHVQAVRAGFIGASGRHVLAPLSRPAVDVLRELVGR